MTADSATGSSEERAPRRERSPGPAQGIRIGYVAILMLLAFAGGLLARGSAGPPGPAGQPALVQTSPGAVPAAPPLDPSQLSGGLPSGHPPVGGISSPPAASASPSPSATRSG